MENRINGVDKSYFAQDLAKSEYLERCSKMTWDQLYAELMRVHAASAKLLSEATQEIVRLNDLLQDETGEYFNSDETH